MALPGGPLDVSMTADASADPVPVSVAVHAPSIPLALVAHYAGLPGSVAGTMKINAELRAAGQSPRDMAASLDGSLSASVIGGRLSNAAMIKLTSASLRCARHQGAGPG